MEIILWVEEELLPRIRMITEVHTTTAEEKDSNQEIMIKEVFKNFQGKDIH